MANKKQRALELAKTEARISGIPKGGSTRTGTTPSEELAYQLTGMGISAGMIGSSLKGMLKLYQAEKKASKISKVSDKKLLELYNKAHPGGRKPPAKKKISKKAVGTGAALAATAAATSADQLSKITPKKKYAKGGLVKAGGRAKSYNY